MIEEIQLPVCQSTKTKTNSHIMTLPHWFKNITTLVAIMSISASTVCAELIQFNSLPDEASRTDLCGEWKFKYIPAQKTSGKKQKSSESEEGQDTTGDKPQNAGKDEDFIKPSFDVSSWKSITVPGHWELQGFAQPKYADELDEGLGLYRRTFKATRPTNGSRVYLRFEGALFGYAVFVNGKRLGEWNSGFQPATFDITDALQPGSAENVLAVRIYTRSRGWDFNAMDCWSISGIYREVSLYTLPANHILDHTVTTTLESDGSATIAVQAKAKKAAEIEVRLIAPDGSVAGKTNLKLGNDGQGKGSFKLAKPALWTAETPTLYRMELDLREGNVVVQKISNRVGVRQISVDNGVFKINGQPVKLRGVNHHEIWPEGRVATFERMKKDLTLMRAANINFIRTSHYPPHPSLLTLADEMGIYVDCEIPFIHGRRNLKDPNFQPDLDERARAGVGRDKNHASVIFWSLGNENPINTLGSNVGKLVKELDPTRPITFPTIGSYFRNNWQNLPEHMDIYAPHYPSGSTVRDYATQLKKPFVATEFSHMRGISRGGKGLQEAWDAMLVAPNSAGGAIWLFQDQGILRTTDDASKVANADQFVWLDESRYFDTNGYFGVDGIVYSDRTPQLDYWLVRKVYAPVRIEVEGGNLVASPEGFAVQIENRNDFLSLKGYNIRWKISRNGQSITEGTLPLSAVPHATEKIVVPAKVPADAGDDVLTLELRCIDPAGTCINERTWRVPTNTTVSKNTVLLKTMPNRAPTSTIDDAFITAGNADWKLTVDRQTGQISLTDAKGTKLFTAAGPHVSRKLLITEVGKKRVNEKSYWQGELLTELKSLRTSVEKDKDQVIVVVGGEYLRPGHADQTIEGEVRFRLRSDNTIEVSYNYLPKNTKDSMVEVGYSVAVPSELSEFRWLGQGPYATYPGKDRQSEYGLHRLNRDDLYFPGNRRNTEFAMLTTPAGRGLWLSGKNLTVSVENRDSFTLWSHIADGARKNQSKEDPKDEGVDNKSDFKASSLKSISGTFTLTPLSEQWPTPLRRWCGNPGTSTQPFRPFLRSYDQ